MISSTSANKKSKYSPTLSPSKRTINFITTTTSSSRSYRPTDNFATPRHQITNSTDTNNNHLQRSSIPHSPAKIQKPNFSDNQKSLIKKVQQLANQHHYRQNVPSSSRYHHHQQQQSSSSFISCSSSSNKMYGVQKSSKIGATSSGLQPIHSNKLSLNSNSGLFDQNCVKLATPTYAGMSSSTIYEHSNSSNNNTRQSSISNEKVMSPARQSISQVLMNKEQIISYRPSNENSPEQKVKKQGNIKVSGSQKQEDVGFYDRLFQKLGEESPYPNHPSTTYSPLPSSIARKADQQLLSTPGKGRMPQISLLEEEKANDMTTNTAGFAELNSVEIDSHQNSKNIIVGTQVANIKEQTSLQEEDEQQDDEELSPIAKDHPNSNIGQILLLRESGESFLNISNGQPDMNLRSFLKQSQHQDAKTMGKQQQGKEYQQVPALQLQPTSLIPECDSSPQPIRLTKQYMRKSLAPSKNAISSSSKRDSIFRNSSNKNLGSSTSRNVSSNKRLSNDKNTSLKTSRINNKTTTTSKQQQINKSRSKKPRPFEFSFTNPDCNVSKTSRVQTQGSDMHNSTLSFHPKNSAPKNKIIMKNALTINTSINSDQFNNSLVHQNTCKNATHVNVQDDLQKGALELKKDIEGGLVTRPVTTRAKSVHYKSFKQNLPGDGFPLFRKKKEHSSSASLQLRNRSIISNKINRGQNISSSNYSSKNGGSSTARFQEDTQLNSARNSSKWKYSYKPITPKLNQMQQKPSEPMPSKRQFLAKGSGVGGGTPCKRMLESSLNNRKQNISQLKKSYDSKGAKDTSSILQSKSMSMKKRYDFSHSGLKTTRNTTPQPSSRKKFQRNSSRTKSFLDNNQTATTLHSSIHCSKSNKYQNSSLIQSTSSSKQNNAAFASNQNTKPSPKVSSPSMMISTTNNTSTKNSTYLASNSSPANKKHNFISSPSSRNRNNLSKTLHFALFKTQSNIKYGCIPVEEKIFTNPEKAFKSFISSLKEDEMLNAGDEEEYLGDKSLSHRKKLKSLQKNLDMEETDNGQQQPTVTSSISHHLAQMLSNQKNIRMSKDTEMQISDQSQVIQEELPVQIPQESGRKSGNHSKRASVQNRNNNEQEDDLEFQLMETLSKKGTGLKAISDALYDVKIISGRESQLSKRNDEEEFKQFDAQVEQKNLGRVSPLQLPISINESCNKSKQESEVFLKSERSSQKHHPSRSQNYSFGAGYQAADQQSTARKQNQQMITPRLSTEQQTQEEMSLKNKSNQSSPAKVETQGKKKKTQGVIKLKGKRHQEGDIESPEKIKYAKKQEVTQLRSAKKVTKTHKKNAIPNHSYQNSQKYFSLLNSVDFEKELLNLDKNDSSNGRKCFTEAPQIDMETIKEQEVNIGCYGSSSGVSSQQKSQGTQSSIGTKIARANREIADVRHKVEKAIDRVNEKVQHHQMKQKKLKQTENDGVKNVSNSVEQVKISKQTKIPSPSKNYTSKSSRKGNNYDLPLSSSKIGKSWARQTTPKASQKTSADFKLNTSRKIKNNDQKPTSILSRNISPALSQNTSRLSQKSKKSNTPSNKAQSKKSFHQKQVQAKIIVQESKYRAGMGRQQQSNRNNSLIIKQFDDLKMQIGSPHASFSLFYRIQDLASRIIQRNYKSYITRKRVLQNIKRISLAKKRMNKQLEAFQMIPPEFKVYKSSETQTDSSLNSKTQSRGSLQQLIFTGEIVKRFGFSAFYTMRAFHYLLLKMNKDGGFVKKQQQSITQRV